jgi:hydroxymethylbilane synthase
MQKKIVIATRQSKLALTQANMVAEHLEGFAEGYSCSIEKMVTTGDKRLEWSLEKQGGKGLFTKELEDALLEKRADIAVHSAKDLPTEMPEGLVIAGFLPRADPCDVIIIRNDINSPKVIATSSPRRRSQLKKIYPNATWTEIRGNVETRLRKIAEGEADATVLAAAGLNRLQISGFENVRFEKLSIEDVVPATGQAAIAIQCREKDLPIYQNLFDKETATAIFLERKCLELMGGGCHSAMASFYDGKTLHIYHENSGKILLEMCSSEKEWEEQVKTTLEKNNLI